MTKSMFSLLTLAVGLGIALPSSAQNAREELTAKVDAVVAKAYGEASARFPCKLKPSGKAKMGGWKDVENCVNPAHDLVDWDGHAAELLKIREEARALPEDLEAAVEAALTAHALPYAQVFLVKEKDEGLALLPLSNSLLKFLPEGSLAGLPVYLKDGELAGSFIGAYGSERSGGLVAMSSYRMANFQYTDLKGEAQAPTERFLVDSYGVPWRDAKAQPGFRLPADKLLRR